MQSELSGTISQIYVGLGTYVYRGQKLASFSRNLDPTQISYLNAQNNVNTTSLSAQNTIVQSETALKTAQLNLEQTKAAEIDNETQTYETLQTQAVNADSTFFRVLDTLDQWAGISNKYKYEINPQRFAVGGRNRIEKNNFENQVEGLLRDYKNLAVAPHTRASGKQIFNYASERLRFSKELQGVLTLFDQLVRQSVFSSTFTTLDQANLASTVAQLRSSLDGTVLGLEQAVTAAQSFDSRSRLSILAAENQVKNAEAQLKLAQANAESQIQGAKNQLQIAAASQADLDVRAPFSGTISERFIKIGQQVSTGTQMFQLLNDQARQYGVAFLTEDEYLRIANVDTFKLTFADKSYEVETADLSTRLDPQSQKFRVEITLPSDLEVLVGAIGRLELGINQQRLRHVPISAVSFEPDGAEVLLVRDGVTVRQKVEVDDIDGDAITLTAGLEEGDLVVRYRRRYHAGMNVKPF